MEDDRQLRVPGAGKGALVDIGTAWGHHDYQLLKLVLMQEI